MTNARTLPQIAKAIKALEKALDKVTLPKVLEIGKLLHEASEKCEYGEYMKWVANEFEWSHQTSLNYRNLYDFSKFPNVGNLARLNMSLSTLYMVAGLKHDGRLGVAAARKAIIKAAKQGYVSLRMAEEIYKKFLEQSKPPPSPAPPSDKAPPPDEAPPSDDEPSDEDADDDDDDIEQPSKLSALVREMQDISENDPAWPDIITDIGIMELRRIIATLQKVCNALDGISSAQADVKAKADRAERVYGGLS
jgi:Protein of unknown function (DUF3102)